MAALQRPLPWDTARAPGLGVRYPSTPLPDPSSVFTVYCCKTKPPKMYVIMRSTIQMSGVVSSVFFTKTFGLRIGNCSVLRMAGKRGNVNYRHCAPISGSALPERPVRRLPCPSHRPEGRSLWVWLMTGDRKLTSWNSGQAVGVPGLLGGISMANTTQGLERLTPRVVLTPSLWPWAGASSLQPGSSGRCGKDRPCAPRHLPGPQQPRTAQAGLVSQASPSEPVPSKEDSVSPWEHSPETAV